MMWSEIFKTAISRFDRLQVIFLPWVSYCPYFNIYYSLLIIHICYLLNNVSLFKYLLLCYFPSPVLSDTVCLSSGIPHYETQEGFM